MVRTTTTMTNDRKLEAAMDSYLNDPEKFNRKFAGSKPKASPVPVPVPDKPSEYDTFFKQYAGNHAR